MEKNYQVLLYYCYAPIEQPEVFREEHHQLCLQLDLRGRIIIAPEGLNGTVSGTPEACESYMQAIHADPRFAKTEFKIEAHHGHAFLKLHVRVKPEIVHSSLRHLDPNQRTGAYLEPQQWQEMIERDDVVILDVRSEYEHKVGHFKNALTLDIDNFRDFPQRVEELKALKDKKILTYCTGGIKCEKASAYLLEQGFENVYQLHGGIIKYGLETEGKDFEGKCYVFDSRVTVDINKENPKVISTCCVCGTASDRMINCASPSCNSHEPMCEDCGWKMEGCCSAACKEDPRKRRYDGTGYYAKATNHYNPRMNAKRFKPEVTSNQGCQ